MVAITVAAIMRNHNRSCRLCAATYTGDSVTEANIRHAILNWRYDDIVMDDLSANWLRIKAEAANTTPEAIIRQLVGKEIAASAM